MGVILREIEHLAAIARSFSRFGAPQAAGEAPLEAVSIQAVAEEVMNLYRGGEGALEFECTVPPGSPSGPGSGVGASGGPHQPSGELPGGHPRGGDGWSSRRSR